MNKRKTPAIRFKGYQNDWEQRKVGDITIESTEYTTLDAGYPLLTSSRAGLMYQNEYRGNLTTDSKETLFSVVPIGACTYRHMSDDDVFHLNINTLEKGLVSREYPVFFATKENCLNFIIQYINSSTSFRAFCAEQKKGGTRTRLYYNALCEFKMMVPSKREQEVIAGYLLSLDHLITLHQRKLDKLKILKKTMLENCFPQKGESVPRVRFAGFTGDWEQRKLADVAEIIGGGTPSTSNPDYWDGDIDWYAPAEIGEQIFAYGSVRKITKEGLIHSSAKILPAHKTVLFTSRAGIGNMAILKRPAATNQGFQSLVCHDDIDPYFMFSMGDSIKAKAERVAAGSTFAEISGKKLGELEFMFPDTGEQKAIGVYFKNLDHLITLHQCKLEKLQTIKKSLLRSMFV